MVPSRSGSVGSFGSSFATEIPRTSSFLLGRRISFTSRAVAETGLPMQSMLGQLRMLGAVFADQLRLDRTHDSPMTCLAFTIVGFSGAFTCTPPVMGSIQPSRPPCQRVWRVKLVVLQRSAGSPLRDRSPSSFLLGQDRYVPLVVAEHVRLRGRCAVPLRVLLGRYRGRTSCCIAPMAVNRGATSIATDPSRVRLLVRYGHGIDSALRRRHVADTAGHRSLRLAAGSY